MTEMETFSLITLPRVNSSQSLHFTSLYFHLAVFTICKNFLFTIRFLALGCSCVRAGAYVYVIKF